MILMDVPSGILLWSLDHIFHYKRHQVILLDTLLERFSGFNLLAADRSQQFLSLVSAGSYTVCSVFCLKWFPSAPTENSAWSGCMWSRWWVRMTSAYTLQSPFPVCASGTMRTHTHTHTYTRLISPHRSFLHKHITHPQPGLVLSSPNMVSLFYCKESQRKHIILWWKNKHNIPLSVCLSVCLSVQSDCFIFLLSPHQPIIPIQPFMYLHHKFHVTSHSLFI